VRIRARRRPRINGQEYGPYRGGGMALFWGPPACPDFRDSSRVL